MTNELFDPKKKKNFFKTSRLYIFRRKKNITPSGTVFTKVAGEKSAGGKHRKEYSTGVTRFRPKIVCASSSSVQRVVHAETRFSPGGSHFSLLSVSLSSATYAKTEFSTRLLRRAAGFSKQKFPGNHACYNIFFFFLYYNLT